MIYKLLLFVSHFGLFSYKVVAKDNLGAVVNYLRVHGEVWSVDEQEFRISQNDVSSCIALQGPELELVGNRCYYRFKASFV